MVYHFIAKNLILVFAGTGSVSIFDFSSLIDIPVGISSASVGLNVCVIAAGNEIKKMKKKRITK